MPTVMCSALALIVSSSLIMIAIPPRSPYPCPCLSWSNPQKQLEHASIIIMARIMTVFFSCRPPLLLFYHFSDSPLRSAQFSNLIYFSQKSWFYSRNATVWNPRGTAQAQLAEFIADLSLGLRKKHKWKGPKNVRETARDKKSPCCMQGLWRSSLREAISYLLLSFISFWMHFFIVW